MNALLFAAIVLIFIAAAIYRSKTMPRYASNPIYKYGVPADKVTIEDQPDGKLLAMQWQARTQSDISVTVNVSMKITGQDVVLPESLVAYVFVVVSAEIRRLSLKDLLMQADEVSRQLDEYVSNSLADSGHSFSTTLKVEISYPQGHGE